MLILEIRGADGGDEPEIDHDEEFTKAEVAVGLRTTGVEPSG